MTKEASAFIVALLAFLPSSTSAQIAQGELRGTVVDQSGGLLPGVTVTATHVETGTSRTATSGVNGDYLMPAMPLGTYKVSAELSGFSTMVRECAVERRVNAAGASPAQGGVGTAW